MQAESVIKEGLAKEAECLLVTSSSVRVVAVKPLPEVEVAGGIIPAKRKLTSFSAARVAATKASKTRTRVFMFALSVSRNKVATVAFGSLSRHEEAKNGRKHSPGPACLSFLKWKVNARTSSRVQSSLVVLWHQHAFNAMLFTSLVSLVFGVFYSYITLLFYQYSKGKQLD